jgi:hypothetical protein
MGYRDEGFDDGVTGVRVGCCVGIALILGLMVLGTIGLFNLAAG